MDFGLALYVEVSIGIIDMDCPNCNTKHKTSQEMIDCYDDKKKIKTLFDEFENRLRKARLLYNAEGLQKVHKILLDLIAKKINNYWR